MLEHSILNSCKFTRETLSLISQNIDELQEKIIFYQKKKIDKIKEKYNLFDIDLGDLKYDLDRL